MSKFEITPQEKKPNPSVVLTAHLLWNGSFNFEKMQALGFAWAMFPATMNFAGLRRNRSKL